MDFVISEEWQGRRVKSFLFDFLHLSHAQVVKLKKEGGILLNGRQVFVTETLRQSDLLTVCLEERSSNEDLLPVELPLEILYEDEHLIAVNKPPFMPTHPSFRHYDDTLANALKFLFDKRNIPFVFRAVNRLDRDTSGVVLVSKDKHTSSLLAREISARKMEKRYIALLDGTVEEDGGFIDRRIVRESESIILRRTDDKEGQEAQTDFQVLQRKNMKTLVLAHPITGRTHQLRVHFAYIGHPITGDTLYGSADPIIDRQALHAFSLTFTHPFTGRTLTLRAPLPEDFNKLLKEYGFEKVF